MIEKPIRLASFALFWSRDRRNAFRSTALDLALKVKDSIAYTTCRALPKTNGHRTVERSTSILGCHLSRKRIERSKYRVALLVDEFFGGWNTQIGGYGAIARKYLCKYIPNDQIQMDVLLDSYGGRKVESEVVDKTAIYRLPHHRLDRQRWLDEQAYDLFLSIEMTEPSFKIIRDFRSSTPLLYWIQDPRDLKMYQPRAKSVNRLRDSDWAYIKDVSLWMQDMVRDNRVSFISQGESLTKIARDMYNFPDTVVVHDLPNPVEIDFDYKYNTPPKENKIIFLGRLEAQKRVWMVCEIAKLMPEFDFYILGATGKGRNEAGNARSLEEYRNPDGTSKIKNLHFTGHVDGEAKNNHIKTAKILLNTSIWEGIPVSWLEALSYGTVVVSSFERDDIVSRFGTFVGEVMGDGTDPESLQRFVKAISYWMTNDEKRNETAQKGIEFTRARHSVPAFIQNMRTAILKEIR
ncbi:MAG TPA: glycosyltransferase family 4 protein [Verrucomicrobiae bacterium]|nr:glycosyltransferase family 4 protein [Verrucomicrobiae bacterium]HVX87280.1 glycosyltransferase family 4 protein [Phycisphaerae bacterium]